MSKYFKYKLQFLICSFKFFIYIFERFSSNLRIFINKSRTNSSDKQTHVCIKESFTCSVFNSKIYELSNNETI